MRKTFSFRAGLRSFNNWARRRHFLTFVGTTTILATFLVNEYEKDPSKEQKDAISGVVQSFQDADDARIADDESALIQGALVQTRARAQGLDEYTVKLRVLPIQRADIARLRTMLVKAKHQLEKLPSTDSETADVVELLNGQQGEKLPCDRVSSIACLELIYRAIRVAVQGNFDQLPKDHEQADLVRRLLDRFTTKGASFNAALGTVYQNVERTAKQRMKKAEDSAWHWKIFSGCLYAFGLILGVWDALLGRADGTARPEG